MSAGFPVWPVTKADSQPHSDMVMMLIPINKETAFVTGPIRMCFVLWFVFLELALWVCLNLRFRPGAGQRPSQVAAAAGPGTSPLPGHAGLWGGREGQRWGGSGAVHPGGGAVHPDGATLLPVKCWPVGVLSSPPSFTSCVSMTGFC